MTPALPVDRLRSAFEGEIVLPGDAGYESARRVWSALHDRRPALVVRPTTAADVASAIRFGRDLDLLIAVRCGGHSISGHSTCDDGMVVDLSLMRGTTVDPARRHARVNGGAHLADLDRAAQEHGLVCPIGTVGHTGVGGLALGGGVGRLQRRFGLTLDSLTAVELVTAEGSWVRASEEENADLFWGIRGAGANFGVVTAFEFRLHPFGPNLTRGFRIYAAEDGPAIWEAFRRLVDTAPREMGINFVIGRAIPEEEYAEELRGRAVCVIAFNHTGTEAEVAQLLAPLGDAAKPAMETSSTRPYLEIQGMYDETYDWGQRYYGWGGFADELRASTIAALLAHATEAPNGDAGFSVTTQGGAIADLDEDATAFTGRSARFRVMAEGPWSDPTQDDAVIEWCRRAMSIAEPDLTVGRYVNEVFEHGTDPATIYGPGKIDRLIALKGVWDPANVFRMNQNIQPRPTAPSIAGR